MRRVDTLLEQLLGKADGALVTSYVHYRYYSGFSGSNCALLLTPKQNYLLTDSRYLLQAREEAEGFEIVESTNFPKTLAALLEKDPLPSLAFEAQALSYGEFQEYEELLPTKLVPGAEFALPRLVKEPDEIAKIRQAASITDQAFAQLLPQIKIGIRERELALELEYLLRKLGGEALAFPSIVASGPRSALPHAQPGERKLELGDFVVFDFGARYRGYCADMTRTVAIGDATEKMVAIYDTVLLAQTKALAQVRPGLDVLALDSVARDSIAEAGYGEFFSHSLGHGVGLEVHEEPALSPRGKGELAPGMVITIEPGIYLPEFGGVRIEDLVLVTEEGAEILSATPKDLLILG